MKPLVPVPEKVSRALLLHILIFAANFITKFSDYKSVGKQCQVTGSIALSLYNVPQWGLTYVKEYCACYTNALAWHTGCCLY